jgi:hypothetical protein
MRRRSALPAAVLAVGVLLAVPGAAGASRSQQTIFDATAALLGVGERDRRQGLNELDALGVDTIRIVFQWRSASPSPGRPRRPAGFDAADPRDYPQGAFSSLDAAIRGAAARGMRVLLTPSGPIPDWASRSSHSRLAEPLPAELRRFAAALGRRYGGAFRPGAGAEELPRVRHWSVWSEPNQDIFLRPQFRRGRPYSPRLYRRLFLAAQAGLRASGHRGDVLLVGETAPSGGRTGVDPIPFLRGMLCLDRSFDRRPGCGAIAASGYAHHPYSLGLAPHERSSNRGLVNLATIDRMIRALRRAAAAGATSRRLGLHLTEYGIQTRPDRRFGVSFARQVAYLAISEFLSWREAAIRSYGQYLLRDDPPRYEFSFTTGLRRSGGRPKPSLRSFPMTLLVRRRGARRVVLWGHVRPGGGPRRVEVSYRDRGGKARVLRAVRTNRGGYFRFAARFRVGRRWAAECRLPGGRRLAGPYLRAVRF